MNIENITRNIHSQNCLSSLINGYPYLPFSDSSLDYHSLHVLVNDIVINQRKSLIEFGSGISTFIIGRLLKSNNIKAHLYTIDDNEDWSNTMVKMVKNEGLEEYITLLYAPLDKISTPKEYSHTLDWYSTKVLDQHIGSLQFDFILVDGPMAYMKHIERSRFPAATYMKEKMAPNSSIFLHDTNREGEQSIIKDWTKILNTELVQFTLALTGLIRGTQYTISVSK